MGVIDSARNTDESAFLAHCLLVSALSLAFVLLALQELRVLVNFCIIVCWFRPFRSELLPVFAFIGGIAGMGSQRLVAPKRQTTGNCTFGVPFYMMRRQGAGEF